MPLIEIWKHSLAVKKHLVVKGLVSLLPCNNLTLIVPIFLYTEPNRQFHLILAVYEKFWCNAFFIILANHLDTLT